MSKEVKKALVPELRFPEFQDDWRSVELGKCFTNIGGTALEKHVTAEGTHHFISIGNYSTDGKYIDKGQRVEANGVTKSKLLNENDLVMVLNDKTLAGDIIGSALLIDEDDKYIYNQRSERLIVGSDLTPIFAWHLLNSQIVRKEVFKRSQGGTQIYVNFPSVKAIKLTIPKEPKEQQKIADCLSSIDDLITAHTQKHDTLKAHKKGLMQQLFPAEGETVPKLRFPEFQGAGEWEEKRLKDISLINQGLQIPISKRFTERVESSYFYITNEFLKTNSNKAFYIQNPSESVICDKDDILMTRTGNTGQVVTNVSGAFHNNFFKIKYSNEIDKDFFVFFLRFENTQRTILNLAGTSTIPDLNHSDFYRIEIKLPTLAEQQKIAGFLSSIDNLITAQSQKIESLKAHKKGLMQQLFPTADEMGE